MAASEDHNLVTSRSAHDIEISDRIQLISDQERSLFSFFEFVHGAYAQRDTYKTVGDFLLGNPHHPHSQKYADILCSHLKEANAFPYTTSAPEATDVVVQKLIQDFQLPSSSDRVIMTTGAFAGISAALACLVNPGDDVLYLSPSWFFYRSMILFFGGHPIPLPLVPASGYILSVDTFASIITPSTRVLILNSPHNPTGRVFTEDELHSLVSFITKHFPYLWIIHDAAYHDIVYDCIKITPVAAVYPRTITVYTWGKIVLTPGQRIGFIALPVTLESTIAQQVLKAIQIALFINFAHPNVLLQHCISEIDGNCRIDILLLQHRRNLMYEALIHIGYEIPLKSEGSFYLLVNTPGQKLAAEAVRLLFERDVFVLDGAFIELPHYFRICLTATTEMCENSIPVFDEVYSMLCSGSD